jgi:hypothetical protein
MPRRSCATAHTIELLRDTEQEIIPMLHAAASCAQVVIQLTTRRPSARGNNNHCPTKQSLLDVSTVLLHYLTESFDGHW